MPGWLPLLGGAVGLLIVFWPAHAFAWGPLAHLEFGEGALASLDGVPAALRALLGNCSDSFLYGTLAADMIVGKNLARYAVHCHNWRVGFQVLEQVRGDDEHAFAWGFLAHLAADTVAHNYYVPYKTVQSYGRRRCGHAYWELRYDQRLSPELYRTARRVSRRALRRHDAFLKEMLEDSAVLPFGLSKRLFEGLLLSARLKRWQKMSTMMASRRKMPLDDEEIAELRALAVGQIVELLRDGPEARCTTADPTGLRNLRLATDMRRRLRLARARGVGPEQVAETVAKVRPAFREAIHGPLHLPHLDALYQTA